MTKSGQSLQKEPPFVASGELDALIDLMKGGAPLALVGAGASKPSGYPLWKELLTDLRRKSEWAKSAHVGKNTQTARRINDIVSADPTWLAQEYVGRIPKNQFKEYLENTFRGRLPVNEPHKLIASLPFRHFLTTNYDPCIEVAVTEVRGESPTPVRWSKLAEARRFLTHLNGHEAETKVVYLHGRYDDDPEDVVLTEESYARLYLDEASRRRLSAIFLTQPVVFIGFSMTDLDLNQLMREAYATLGGRSTHHFGIFGYELGDDLEMMHRRMEQKFGIRAVFYLIEHNSKIDRNEQDHGNQNILLTHICEQCDPAWKSKKEAKFKQPVTSPLPPASAPKPAKRKIPDVTNPSDPQKGRWDGSPTSNDWLLSVDRQSIKVSDKAGWVSFTLVVEKTKEPVPATGKAKFHLHPSFDYVDYAEKIVDGKATTEITAWGAFTVGVEVDDGDTRLELDLAELTFFPKWWRDQ